MRRSVKILGIGFATFVILLVAAMVVVPLVVDVDKYRPQVIQMVNENINGKFDLGKLKLSMWGQIRVDVAGVQLFDKNGTPVLSVKEAYFHIPFAPILTGSPVMTFKMLQPEVSVYKGKDGKLNVLTLMKDGAAKKDAAAAKPVQPSGGGGVALPAIAMNARFGMELLKARLTYKDTATLVDTQINDLNFVVRDVSLSRPMEVELDALLDTKVGKTISVKGPAKMTAKIEPKISNEAKFESASIVGDVNLDDLEVTLPDLFYKKKGMAANAQLNIFATEKEAKINHFNLKFFNVDLKSQGTVTGLTPATPGGVANPVIAYTMKSNTIDFKPWNELVPMLKNYELAGTGGLDLSANGPADKLNYAMNMTVNGLTAKAPNLKTQPRFDMVLKVITDKVENFTFTMKAPANDLKVAATVVNFAAPAINVDVTSTGMDLDQMIDWPPPAAKAAKTVATGGSEAGQPLAKASPLPDVDAQLEPMRENPAMGAMKAQMNVNIKFIKAYKVSMNDIVSKMSFKDLNAAVDHFGMNVFGGKISGSMLASLKPKVPTYRFAADVSGFDMKQAAESQAEFMKNTIYGKAYFKMDGTGSSFNTVPATKNLNAKGTMRVENASFATINVGKMVAEGINKGLEKVASKIPQVKDKKIGEIPGREGGYELIASDFTIANGVFTMPNFVGKARPNQGVDIKGVTSMNLIDYSLKAQWELIDTYNLTKARDISVSMAGVNVEHLLAEGANPVRFPVSIGCTAMAPCYSYTDVPEHFFKVAMANTTGAAEGRLKAEANKKAEEARQAAEAVRAQAEAQAKEAARKAAEDAARNAAQQGIGKKLFGR